jgi:RNA polymerase sigma factor (TIGR02999 family)
MTHKSIPASSGASHRAEELLPLVYEELRRLASGKLAHERPGQTLQPTALVHEAWLRLIHSSRPGYESSGDFFAAAAEAMRRILVENARHKQRIKHGGEYQRSDFDELQIAGPMPDEDLLALDEALNQLTVIDAQAAQLVNLRFFTGLTQAQAAEQLGISRSTADRTWVFARAWLFERIEPELPQRPDHPPQESAPEANA